MNDLTLRIRNKLMHPANGIKGRWYKHFNRWKFRFLGVHLGSDADIRNKVYFEVNSGATVTIGHQFVLYSGDNLSPLCADSHASICVYPNASLQIGHNSGMSGGTIWCTHQIKIGNFVNIGGNCTILDGDMHNISWQQRRKDRKESISYKKAPVIIDDDVWIGANCTILKGVHIGTRSIISAGSVVINDIPSDCIAAGNPCVVVKHL